VCRYASEEKRAGVTGFAEAQETLEEVSKAKGTIDEEKGNTLEEISEFVAKINTAIKAGLCQLLFYAVLRGANESFSV
jgi:hypothetical protein